MEQMLRYGKWKQLDADKNMVCPCIYEHILPFSEGVAAVCLGNKWGAINEYGDLVIPCAYARPFFFWKGMSVAEKPVEAPQAKTADPSGQNKRFQYFVIDREGKRISDIFDDYNACCDAMHALQVQSAHGDAASAPAEKEAWVRILRKGKWGLANSAGEIIIPCMYQKLIDASEGMAAVRTGMQWQFWDLEQNAALPGFFEDCQPFSEGKAAVKRHGKWGYIDRYGRLEVDCIFDEANPVYNGYAHVRLNGGEWILAYAKRLLLPLLHGFSYYLSPAYALAMEKSKRYCAKAEQANQWGVIDQRSMRPLTPFAYEDLNMLDEQHIKVKQCGKWGVINAGKGMLIPIDAGAAMPGDSKSL